MIQTMSHAGLSIQDAAMLERDHCMKELAHNSKTLHGSPRSAPDRLAPDPIPTSRPFSHRLRPSTPPPTPSPTSFSASVPTPANFNTASSLHSVCIRPASA
jgi:hypothetical protein